MKGIDRRFFEIEQNFCGVQAGGLTVSVLQKLADFILPFFVSKESIPLELFVRLL